MKSIQEEIQVGFRYTVHFTTDVFVPSNTLLRQLITAKVLFVVDAGTSLEDATIENYCLHHKLQLAGPVVFVPGGEEVKNQAQFLEQILCAIEAA